MLDKKFSSSSSTGHSTTDEVQVQVLEPESSSASGGEKNSTRNCSFGNSHNNSSTPRSTSVGSSQKIQDKTRQMTISGLAQGKSPLSDSLVLETGEKSKMDTKYNSLDCSKDSLGEDEQRFNVPVFKESYDDLPIIPGFHSDIDDDFNEKTFGSKDKINSSVQSFEFFNMRIGTSTNGSTKYHPDTKQAINTRRKFNEEEISDEYKTFVDHANPLSSTSYQELASELHCTNASNLSANEFFDAAEVMGARKHLDLRSTRSAATTQITSANPIGNYQHSTEANEQKSSPNYSPFSGPSSDNTPKLHDDLAVELGRHFGQHSLGSNSELTRKFGEHSLSPELSPVSSNKNNLNFDNDNNLLALTAEAQLGEDQNSNANKESCRKAGGGESPLSNVSDEKEMYDVVWVEPDGGWGWWVLFGSMIVNILIPGTVKSFGVLFIEFLEVFKTSPSAAAWIPAISYFLYSSTGPFAGALAIRYSHRSVTIVGGLLAAAGLALSYFATSIGFLYISYGLIGGLGAGLAYPIGVFIVGKYFNKRRGLANGLCTSGSALGSVLIPPLLRCLLEQYGYRHAVLIMGALLLNVCLAALFYDPVEQHLKKKLIPRDPLTTPNSCTENTQTPGSSPSRTQGIHIQNIPNREREIMASLPIAIPRIDSRDIRDRRNSSGIRRATFQIGQDTPQGDDSWSLKSIDVTSPLAVRLLRDENGELPNSPRANSGTRSRGGAQSSLESDTDILYTGSHYINGSGAASIQPSNAASRSKINLSAIPEDEDGIADTPGTGSRGADWNFYKGLPSSRQRLLKLSMEQGNQLMGQNQQSNGGTLSASATQTGLARTMSIASNVSNSSFHYVSTIHHGSILMAMQYDKNLPQFASTFTLKSVGGSCWKCLFSLPKKCLRKVCLCKKRREEVDAPPPEEETESTWNLIDYSLLKDGFFIIMLLSTSMSAVGYTNFLILLPAYALGMGFDKSKASLLLSYVAAFDFVGRIGGAALSDLKLIPRFWFFVIGILGSGIALALLPLAQEYYTLAIFCGIFGLSSGTYIGVTAVILADKLGTERLGSSYGLTLFLNGILQLIGPPSCGAIYEKLGKYEPIFVALGLILMFGASLWIAVPVVERHKALKFAREEEAKSINILCNQNSSTRKESGSLVV